MKGFTSALLSALVSSTFVAAQTYTNCSPLEKVCPPDPALGGTFNADFTKGESNGFTPAGTSSRLSYSGDGAGFSVITQGDSPMLISNWYFMFGRIDVVMKAAPGTGIVSSIVMESDDLDEVDWEFLGGDGGQVQSNYFGKGNTDSYNRGAFHPLGFAHHEQYATYSVVWTSGSISWIINGNTVRQLNAADAGNFYPQTPMRLKLGIWAGGDPRNNEGTIQWAGGQTTYTESGYTMLVKSATVQDYSTGKTYTYGDHSGSWKSIVSDGGSIYADPNPPNGGTPTKPDAGSAVTPGNAANPLTPFQSTFMTIGSSDPQRTGWPWVSTDAQATKPAGSPSESSPSPGLYSSLPRGGKQAVDKGLATTSSDDESATATSEPTTTFATEASSTFSDDATDTASSTASASPTGAASQLYQHTGVSIALSFVISILCIL